MKKLNLVKLTDRDIRVFQFLIDRELNDYKYSIKYEPINEYREMLRIARVNVSMTVSVPSPK